jgi:hypothetical protein
MYNLILKHIGVFIVKTIHLFISSLALLLISCGGSDSVAYIPSDTKSIVDYPSSGEGTFQAPYNIGSGLYKFKGEKYYTVDVVKNECNVLVYGVDDFDSISDVRFIDDSHKDEVAATYNYLYQDLDKDGYDIIVDSDTYSIFGVFSPCIDDKYSKSDAYVELNAGDRMTMEESSVLYKFNITRTGEFSLNTVGQDVQVRIYNAQMSSVYSESSDKHSLVLTSGDYYMLLSKTQKSDINFIFDVSSLNI